MSQRRAVVPSPTSQKPTEFAPNAAREDNTELLEQINKSTARSKVKERFWGCAGGSAFGRALRLRGSSAVYRPRSPCGCGRTMFCKHKSRFSYPIEVDEHGNPIRGEGGELIPGDEKTEQWVKATTGGVGGVQSFVRHMKFRAKAYEGRGK